MSSPALTTALLARRRSGGWAVRCGCLAAIAVTACPFLLVLLVLSLFAGSPEASCQQTTTTAQEASPAAGLTRHQRAVFSQPLTMQPGRWYRAGATVYAAGDGTGTGTRGAIPDPRQADLTQHPDSFAELSLKTVNAGITYQTANALGGLPWMTGLRVKYQGKSTVVYKRDIGYGQGKQTIGGERYRIDLWAPAARKLGTTSSLVRLQLAPKTGAGNVTGDTPNPDPSSTPDEACAASTTGGGGPLPLTEGVRAKLLPSGLAAAPKRAPAAVKQIIAAGNQIVGTPYLLGGGHGQPLSRIASTYDCSSAVAHLLYGARLVPVTYTPASGQMTSYGRAGYGRWVSLLANFEHVYLYVAGLRWDTHRYGPSDQGVPGIGWHTARRPDTGFTPRHPPQL